MGQRVVYGAVALLVIFALVVVDVVVAESCAWEGPIGDLLRRGSVIPLAATLMVLLGAVELGRLYRHSGRPGPSRFAYLMVAVLMLSPWLSAAGWLGEGAVQLEGVYWQIIWLAVAVTGTASMQVFRGDPATTSGSLGASWSTVLYLGFMGSFTVHLRCSQDVASTDGAWLLLITLLVTKFSDIGAYFVGSACGRHKLAPRLSPGKTIEGALGGLLFSGGVALALAVLGATFVLPESVTTDGQPVAASAKNLAWAAYAITRGFGQLALTGRELIWWPPFVFGVIVSVFAQLGDLLESSFKREAGAKDSGNLIPRFGGILDLIDSPLVAVAGGLVHADDGVAYSLTASAAGVGLCAR